MIAIFKTKCLLLIRNPLHYIISTLIICLFVYLMGYQSNESMAIASSLNEEKTTQILQGMPFYNYELHTELEARELVGKSKMKVAIFLYEKEFKLVVASDFMDSALLQNELKMQYQKALITKELSPAFQLNYENDEYIYSHSLLMLFSFSLFMVIYTVASGVSYILAERNSGVWDRLLVSSISKWQAYTANLAYAFCISYAQMILVFSIFHYVAGVDFYGKFIYVLLSLIPYLLCVIALAIFIASITSTVSQFNTMMMVIAISFSMLGGLYWSLEFVSSPIIYALSYISPIKYGLEILNGVTLYNSTWNELLQPISILLFMAVVLMGIGINMMEKKANV